MSIAEEANADLLPPPLETKTNLVLLPGGLELDAELEPSVGNQISGSLLPGVEIVPLGEIQDNRRVFYASLSGLLHEQAMNQFFEQDYEPYLAARGIYIWELSQVQEGLRQNSTVTYGLGVHIKERVGDIDDAHIFVFPDSDNDIQRILMRYQQNNEEKTYLSNFDSQPELPNELLGLGLYLRECLHEASLRPQEKHNSQSFLPKYNPTKDPNRRHF